MAKASSTHEHLSQEDVVTVGSERSFGVVFAVVFAVVAAWPLKDGGDIRVWAAVVSGLFLAVTFLVPGLLKPLNIVWFKFGLLLHKIVNPLIMGFLFFLTITPIALLMRLFGKDDLLLSRAGRSGQLPESEIWEQWILEDRKYKLTKETI